MLKRVWFRGIVTQVFTTKHNDRLAYLRITELDEHILSPDEQTMYNIPLIPNDKVEVGTTISVMLEIE